MTEDIKILPTGWIKFYTEEIGHHWLRADGAVVRQSEGYSSCFWLPNYRSYLSYAPGEDYPLSNGRKNSRLKFARQFKTAENAMKRLDAEFPAG